MSANLILRKLVEMAGGPAESGYVLALDGDGLDRIPDEFPTSSATYSVYRPSTELGLRRIIWKSNGAPFIAVVGEDLAKRLPVDLVRRSRGARVHSLDINDVLSLVLGVPLVGTEDRELQQLALEKLEDIQREMKLRTLPTMIDRRLLEEILLDVCVGKRLRTSTAGELLAGWIQQPPAWSPAVTRMVADNLPTLHATDGRVLGWALGDLKRRTRALVIHGALLAIEGEHSPAVWDVLHDGARDPRVGLTDDVFRTVAVRLATEALEKLGDTATGLLKDAETLGRRVLAPGMLAKSNLLPLGLESRCAEIAARVGRGEPVADNEISWARSHRAYPLKRAEVTLLDEMARLSRYLAEPKATARGGVADQVRAYLHDGAFADLTALRLRRAQAATAEFQKEAEKGLAAYRARRDEDNLAFAQTLAGGYVKALHDEQLVPLHRLWTKLVLRDGPAQRANGTGGVFVVVLDGCSYPVFLEILYELTQNAASPIGLSLGESSRAAGVPALSPLPTITSHARGAIFLGQIPKDPWIAETRWRDESETVTDPARFKQNEALATRRRRLFLKGDLTDRGLELFSALRDDALDVVGVVFNAVDDQIGSSNTGMHISVKPDQITGFLPALQTALAAGRRVLVTADHGHSPYWTKDLRVGAGSTPRFTELAPGQSAPEGFMEIDLEGLGGGAGRKAFAWRMGAYQGGPQVGFHGGCSLEEMAVPMAWLVTRGVQADEPSWWFGRNSAVAQPSVAARDGKPVVVPAPTKAIPQGDLFDPRRTVEGLAAVIGSLRLSEGIVAQLDPSERAALVLLHQNGTAKTRDLATAVGKPAPRVSGFMTQLNRKLTRLGVECFRTETLPSGESQYQYVPRTEGDGR